MRSPAGLPSQTLISAIKSLAEKGVSIRRISRFFHTPCFPVGAGPDYVNAAVVVRPNCDPNSFLKLLHKVEAEFARERVERWGQRTLDLDLLSYGQTVLPDAETHQDWRNLPLELQATRTPDQMIIPHPRLQDRAFVLVPVCDVAANWVHPVLRQSAAELLAKLNLEDVASVRPL